jgi:hypothetical protein
MAQIWPLLETHEIGGGLPTDRRTRLGVLASNALRHYEVEFLESAVLRALQGRELGRPE